MNSQINVRIGMAIIAINNIKTIKNSDPLIFITFIKSISSVIFIGLGLYNGYLSSDCLLLALEMSICNIYSSGA